MSSCTHVFQISGIKIREKKKVLVQGIQQLGGKYIGGSVYQHCSTHLIIPQVLSSEKFLAACAAGKWVVTPDYVLDSVKNGSWLAEGPYEVAISTCTTSAFYPVRQWREKVASGRLKGAFQGWRVLLMVQEPTRRAMFKRVIVQDMKFNITDDEPTERKKAGFVDLSKLETELRDYLIKQEGRPRLFFLEFLGYRDPYRPQSQATETDFRNVGSMIECGLFIEALDSIRSAVFPGLLPPAPYLVSLLEYAQQVGPELPDCRNLHLLLRVKKYFTQVLQCPRCKTGLWPFLETAIRDFLLPEGAGVSQASASGSLLCGTFWTVWERGTLLSRAVKQLTQLLVQAAVEVNTVELLPDSLCWMLCYIGQQKCQLGRICGRIRKTKLLLLLLLDSNCDCYLFSLKDYGERDEKQELHLADTLLDLLSVLVEFWCQQHFKLNQNLVEKGLKDLAEHFAVISQDVSSVILAELVVRIRSTRLKLVMADAIFRNLCCRNGFTVGDEPLSLKKMVLSYLPALGTLSQSPTGACLSQPGRTSHSCTSLGIGCRACKRNQVETVLQILALPGTDVNVKDHAGWTPLHEACNHGSTACVEALLRHRPAPVVDNHVGGVTPLHDALLNKHMDIAKLLLEHAGSALLEQTNGNGRTALDLVSATSQKEELLRSAQVGDSAPRNRAATEVLNLPLLESGSCLLAHLIFSYQQERGLSSCTQPSDKSHSLGYKLVRALEAHALQRVTVGWMDQRAVRLVEDAETLLELGRGSYLGRQQTDVSMVSLFCLMVGLSAVDGNNSVSQRWLGTSLYHPSSTGSSSMLPHTRYKCKTGFEVCSAEGAPCTIVHRASFNGVTHKASRDLLPLSQPLSQ
ncbi:SMC5-SMC6 complex localization factor protein 1 [Collichthys lucidus]|uniref:SMC5-SMC6 complex localization factor protein 1 n=1 Tax=Collichthys lucidus TaxID=240159 RepID=A0A4U5UVP2_COLLU|nr:SMC5-SMC6 complex localization factor protein 1 [Collichthys lucidus]